MPTPALTRQACIEAVHEVRRFMDLGYPLTPEIGTNEVGAIRAAAESKHENHSTLRHRVKQAEVRFGITPENVLTTSGEWDNEDGEREDPLEILRRAKIATSAYIGARKKPQVFLMKPEPFCVAFIGDPHLSNKGCDLTALHDDINLLVATGTRAVQVGDILDNFRYIGKLAGNEADNFLTTKQARSLAKWFIAESGVRWDAHVLGNHDAWQGPEGVALLESWVRQAKSRLYDWNARLIYKWGEGPNDQHVVAASHDFKGNSIYNPNHGPMRMALEDGTADTYVAGHRHNHGETKFPNGWRDKTYQTVRVRGYKARDGYSEGRPQFAPFNGMEGRSALLVVNPLSETHDGRQRVFMDLADGIEFTQMLKRRYA
ncbi:hypothetical protein PVV74_17445 [Roseovarius sp. SK2]|uniref:hypothetical protein n=1 Tax=Roseovarius TaxID=74030 RepID=UPI00237A9C7E|nr:hypothetical protein [Roseovarius sp. SK2]MDD9727248.1 hypothetical protein [Roseovarius sp. SK2]